MKTVPQAGWAALKNGDLLLTRAQHEFDAFVTPPTATLPFQQDLSHFSIAVIVLRAQSNRVTDLRRLLPHLPSAVAVLVVLHPAYSGVAQALLGAGLASGSMLALLFTVMVVAPFGLRRARYEEALLLERFGEEYERYASSVGWRRIVPRFVPFGF